MKSFRIMEMFENGKGEYERGEIKIDEIVETKHNKYSMEEIEELAAGIKITEGIQQPIVIGEVDGEKRLVSGHRRVAALKKIIEDGEEKYKTVPCVKKEMSETEFKIELLCGNTFNRKMSDYDLMMQAEEWKKVLKEAKKEGNLILEKGERVRDWVAKITGESTGKIGQLGAIQKNATESIKEQFREGKIGVTAAYEASKLEEGQQEEIAKRAAKGEDVTAEEIQKIVEKNKKKVSESDTKEGKTNQNSDYQTPHPKGITSLCYSCTGYEMCNVKTGTCTECDQYKNRRETYKTEEQKYSEEQDEIDRQTKRRLREMEEKERLNNLPSEKKTEKKYLRAAGALYERILHGDQSFMIVKEDGYKIGQSITVGEFKDGRSTGETMDLVISHIEDDKTTSALDEGYCILNVLKENENNRWIPVKERLPEEPPIEVDDESELDEYLVTIKDAAKTTVLCYAGDGTWWRDGAYYKVSAWKPLPEKYC